MFLFLALTAWKCTNRLQNFDPGDDWRDYVGNGRGAVVRATVTGCPFSVKSKPNWDHNAALFPHVNFLEIDCAKSIDYCINLPLPFEDRSGVPFYVIFPPNSKLPIPASLIRNTVDSQIYSLEFARYAREFLGVYPLIPPIQSLDNQSINNFYKLQKYKALVLYTSKCLESTDYLGKWLDMFGNQHEEELALGAIDCDLFPIECQRWSKNTTAAFVFDKSGAYVEIEPHLGDTIKTINETFAEAIRQARSISPVKTPEPLPYKEEKQVFNTPVPLPAALNYYNATFLEQRSPEEIIQKFRAVNVNPKDVYRETSGRLCDPGLHSQEDKNKTIDFINFLRDLVGIKQMVTYNKTREAHCQHDAHVMRLNKVISHFLSNQTGLMCYRKGFTGKATIGGQIYLGTESAWNSIFGFMHERDDHNVIAGHRRALLDPRVKSMGIGYSQNTYKNWGAAVIQTYDFQDLGIYLYPDENLKFIAWPAPGPFPTELLSFRWSIDCWVFYSLNNITIDDVNITVQRDDGIIFPIKSMLIDTTVGTNGGIIFDLRQSDLILCQPGRNVTVTMHVKKGKYIDCTFRYTTRFFDLTLPPLRENNTFKGLKRFAFIKKDDKEAQKKLTNLQTQICTIHNMTDYKPSQNENGRPCDYAERIMGDYDTNNYPSQNRYDSIYSVSSFNTLNYDIDVVSTGIDLGDFYLNKAPFGREFRFHLNPFRGTLRLRSNQKVSIDDPSLTDFVIEADFVDAAKDTKLKASMIDTIGQAKSVKIVLLNSVKPKTTLYSNSLVVYKGLPAPTEIIGQTSFIDQKFDITVDTFYKNGLNLRVTCINNSEEFYLVGGLDWWERIPILSGVEWTDVPFLKPKRRVMEIHFGQRQANALKASHLPDGRRDYMFTAQGVKYGFQVEQSPELYRKVRRFMIRANHDTAGFVYSHELAVNSSDPFARLLDFHELNYVNRVNGTKFYRFNALGDSDTFYTRNFKAYDGYENNDKRKIAVLNSNAASVKVDDDGFVYKLKGPNSFTFSGTKKNAQASILFTDEQQKTVIIDCPRTYALREIPSLSLTIKNLNANVYIADSNVTIDAPNDYIVKSIEIKELENVLIASSSTSKVTIEKVYINKGTVLELKNVLINTLVVEDCDTKIIGGTIESVQLYGSTVTLKDVKIPSCLFQIVKRKAVSQVIFESGINEFDKYTYIYYIESENEKSKTFALFKGLSSTQCQYAKTKVTNNKFDFNDKLTDHKIECVEQKGTGKYNLIMKGSYTLPPPPPDPKEEVAKIPESKPPPSDDPNNKYCLYAVKPELCGNAKYLYNQANLSLIFKQYDPNPIVNVYEEVAFIFPFEATGNISFQGKGALVGRIEIKPLCFKFSSSITMKNAKINIMDEGVGSLGYVESVFSPMLVHVMHKTKPKKDTTSIKSVLVYQSANSTTSNVDSDMPSQLVSGAGMYYYNVKAYKEGKVFKVNYSREAVPEAVFCIDMDAYEVKKYGCTSIKYSEIKENTGKASKVKIYLGKTTEIKSDIYPDANNAEYFIYPKQGLTFDYDKVSSGKVSSLNVEGIGSDPSPLTFTSTYDNNIYLSAVSLRNVKATENMKNMKILNLFASSDIRKQFAEGDKTGKYMLAPGETYLTTSKNTTIVIPPSTSELTVTSFAEKIDLQPVVKPNQQTSLSLTGKSKTTFNVNIPDVKITLPEDNKASVVLNDVKDLEVGQSNTTISKIILNNVSTTTITGMGDGDIINVNSLHINGNTEIEGDRGRVNVGKFKIVDGFKVDTTNLNLSSEVTIGESSSLLLQKATVSKDLSIVMNGKIDTLPFISTSGTIGDFLPKSLAINVKQDNSKLLGTVDKILISGITKEECASLAGVTSVSSTTTYYPKCVSAMGTYNFVISYEKPDEVDKPGEVPEGVKEGGTSGGGISATTIGIIVAVAAAVIIVIVVVIVVKRRKNNHFNSSDDSESMEVRLSEDPKLVI